MAVKVQRTGEGPPPSLNALVLGPPGAGKTLFGSTWPDPLYLSAEGGLLSLRDLNLPYVEITETEQLNEVRLHLEQDPIITTKMLGVPVRTVILDTIDEIGRMFVKERLIEESKDAMTISDWGWLGDQMRSLTRGFRALEMNVIFTCHLKDDKDEVTGAVSVKPQIQGAFVDQITQAFDLALLLRARPKTELRDGQSFKTTVRFVQTYPDAQHDWVKDRSGKLPPEFELNFTNDYERIAGRVLGSAPPVAAPPPSPPVEVAVTGAKADTVKAPAKPVKAAAKTKAPTAQTDAASTTPDRTTPEQTVAETPVSAAPAEEAVPAGGTAEPVAEPVAETAAAPAAPPEAPAQTPVQGGDEHVGTQPGEDDPRLPAPCSSCAVLVENRWDLRDFERLFKVVYCEKCLAICDDCGGEIDDLRKVERSGIRYRARLDSACFAARKKK